MVDPGTKTKDLTASTTVADADELYVNKSGDTDAVMTRANFLGSATITMGSGADIKIAGNKISSTNFQVTESTLSGQSGFLFSKANTGVGYIGIAPNATGNNGLFIYRTSATATNTEFLAITADRLASNQFEIHAGTEGSGINRNLVIRTGGTNHMTFTAADGTNTIHVATTLSGNLTMSSADILVGGNNVTDIGDLNLEDKTRIVISSGVVTMTQAYHSVDGESDTDDALDTLNGGTAGDIVVLRPDDDAATITVTDAGNIILAGDADFVMSDIADLITLLYDGTNWIELSRSLNHV